MTASSKPYSIWAASMVASLAAAFAAVGATQAGAGRASCEIAANALPGVVALAGRADAATLPGSLRLVDCERS